MNNQAAQTMPELPGPFDVIEQVDKYNFVHNVEVYTADQMHQYARDYAAAISQTAGVPDGWKLVPVEPTEAMCEAAMSSLGWSRSQAAATAAPITPASPMMEGAMKVWSGMLAAAPAASGVHHDALQDGTLSKSTAKRVEALGASGGEYFPGGDIGVGSYEQTEQYRRENPQAAAPVSERARELLAAEFEKDGRHDMAAAIRAGHPNWELSLRAIEQALIQQRGAASYDVGMAMHWIERYAAGIDEECQLDRITEAFTTHQPSADAVRELVKRWRECAKSAANGPMFDGASEYAVAGTYIDCADELESLLSGGSHA